MLSRLIVLAALAVWGTSGAAADPAVMAEPSAAPGTVGAVSEAGTTGTAPAEPPRADDAPRHEVPADGAPVPDGSATETAKPDAPRTRPPRYPQRLTPEQAIDARVRRLTRSLDLDERQQARLREVLQNERRQIRKLWIDNPRPEADRVGPALAIIDRTRDEIRAMLNEEQRKKYPAALPRESLGPANADLEYWMRQTQPAQGAGPGK